MDSVAVEMDEKQQTPVVENNSQNTSENDKQPETKTEDQENGDKKAEEESPPKVVENVDFKVIFTKKKYDVTFPLDNSVSELKFHLRDIIGVPPLMQKVMFKGLAKDGQTLRELGVTSGAKIMVVGSKLDDVLAVSTPTLQDLQDEASEANGGKEPFSKQKMHRKVLDKGVPEDAMPGIRDAKEPLPPFPISGMLNKSGGKVRLTFKLELDQVWIGTKERTDKLPMSSIKGVVSEAIHDHEEYHIMALQLGPTEASRYWVYWVPAQYIDSIKDAILGKWQYF
ncbi:ubiquitin domain-containing protein UBFD1-like isoform X2 [Ischnura elegans]|uniref:ubiquitin domain-containing protein UBFD1-like isoform X2 n=1 Tax=Ischnura elegans TaxID=197161 RepID=UPI001ED8917A|nr:ubiquitin domain-containing protein UBFD1-like isoform X2 [Ischnura elegans]